MEVHGSLWISMEVHGYPWISMEIHGFSLILRIFVDFLRFSLIFVQVRKVGENREKQLFAFFAFLPPYIGVSRALVSRKR